MVHHQMKRIIECTYLSIPSTLMVPSYKRVAGIVIVSDGIDVHRHS